MFQCKVCDHTTATLPVRGNTIVEISLWLIFLVIFMPIPLTYTLWRRIGSKVICPSCKHRTQYIPVLENPMPKNAEEYLGQPTKEEAQSLSDAKLTAFSLKHEIKVNNILKQIFVMVVAVAVLWVILILAVVISGFKPDPHVNPSQESSLHNLVK